MGIKKYCYNGNNKFDIKDFDTNDTGEIKNRENAVKEFVNNLEEINKLQQKLYAERKEEKKKNERKSKGSFKKKNENDLPEIK